MLGAHLRDACARHRAICPGRREAGGAARPRGVRLPPAHRGTGPPYEQVGAWLCLGPWRIPLPRLLSPHIQAETLEATGGMRVLVRIGSPLAGALLTYEGLVTPEEESP